MVSINSTLKIKNKDEVKIMAEGGKRLAEIKSNLRGEIKSGVSAYQIESLAVSLIKKHKAQSSFKMVPGYSWATCVNVNEGVVHGIPNKELVFKNGDIVSVDIGIYFKGFHTDTSISVAINPSEITKEFLDTGKLALKRAIAKASNGNKIYDVSGTIEDTIKDSGYSPIESLVGHGIGRSLHEEPQIPCFRTESREHSLEIREGMVLAIEVMYAAGSPKVVKEPDGWTISTADGKISGLFEETVAITSSGPLILTEYEE